MYEFLAQNQFSKVDSSITTEGTKTMTNTEPKGDVQALQIEMAAKKDEMKVKAKEKKGGNESKDEMKVKAKAKKGGNESKDEMKVKTKEKSSKKSKPKIEKKEETKKNKSKKDTKKVKSNKKKTDA